MNADLLAQSLSIVARLSIIIPTLGNWELLEDTLVSVLQHRPACSEIVVVHNHRYDDPYDLKDEVRFVAAPAKSCLVDLMNRGMAAAEADVLHLLACGAAVDDGWTTAALRRFTESRVGSVAPLVVDVDDRSRSVTAGCLWSHSGEHLAYGSGKKADDIRTDDAQWVGPDPAAAFYRRTALGEVGLFDATMPPRLAAIDLALRLRRAGHRSVLEPVSRVSLATRLVLHGSPFTYAWHGERLFWRQPFEGGRLRTLAAHGSQIFKEVLRALPQWRAVAQLLGHLTGACDRRAPRRAAIAMRASSGTIERRVDSGHTSVPPQLAPSTTKTGARCR